jgi:hypothetical protein
MPQLIQHIDPIAREKQRAVLFLLFNDPVQKDDDKDDFWPNLDYQAHRARQEILAWFEANGVPYSSCAHFASENGMIPYQEQLYIDVPFAAPVLPQPDLHGGLLSCIPYRFTFSCHRRKASISRPITTRRPWALRRDKRLIFVAAGMAQKTADCVRTGVNVRKNRGGRQFSSKGTSFHGPRSNFR